MQEKNQKYFSQYFHERLNWLIRKHFGSRKKAANTLGVHEKTIGTWCRGEHRPPEGATITILELTGASRSWQVTGHDDPAIDSAIREIETSYQPEDSMKHIIDDVLHKLMQEREIDHEKIRNLEEQIKRLQMQLKEHERK